MNTLTTNPSAAQSIARYTIADRVQEAEVRRVARAVRNERQAAARALRLQHNQHPLPWWAFRFPHLAH
jgi:hypothetical protein